MAPGLSSPLCTPEAQQRWKEPNAHSQGESSAQAQWVLARAQRSPGRQREGRKVCVLLSARQEGQGKVNGMHLCNVCFMNSSA